MSVAIIAAPSSGAGKTTVTLALLRALTRSGVVVRSAKIGPDYIDPRFHEAATGRASPNLDPWAMPPARLAALMAGDGPLLIEAAMGLFDGAGSGSTGSAADLARRFDLPIILVVDCARASASIAAVVLGMVSLDPALNVSGLILNRVGSARHEALLREILSRPAAGRRLPPVIGALRRDPHLTHPSRHLGLVQAQERPDLDAWLNGLADRATACIDLTAIFGPPRHADRPKAAASTLETPPALAPPGQRIAIARDAAFAFAYPHLLDEWHRLGAEILPFSPLADDPVPEADFTFLPGGYPELHAGRLAAAPRFLTSLRQAAAHGPVYGECGGYMVLGDGLVDAEGHRHAMAGLLRLETTFAQRSLHLGYRLLQAQAGPFSGWLSGHEFHYSTELAARGAPLFRAWDAAGTALGDTGLREGAVCGSYAHLIDRADHLPAPQTGAR